jgi:hypothetical protein
MDLLSPTRSAIFARVQRAATVLLSAPSAQANTIFGRNANACADLARRDQRTSCARSTYNFIEQISGARH